MTKRRVVITGMGLLSPIGSSLDSAWENALAGKSGANLIEAFDTEDYSVKICASVEGYDVDQYFDRKEARRLDKFIQYGMAAGVEAIADAGLEPNPQDGHRIGLAIGSGIGGLNTIEETHSALLKGGPRRVSPFFIPGSVINMIAGNLSIRYGFKGPNIAIVTACTTGTHNIGIAILDHPSMAMPM